MMLRLCDIHAALGGVLHGDGTRAIAGLASLESAGPDRLAFVGQARHAAAIESTQAAALIVPPELVPRASARGPCIETSQPYPYFARLTQWWRSRQLAAQRAAADPAEPAIHPSAWVHPSAELAAGVRLGAFAVVEAGAQIGAGSEIGAHCVIGARARIGAQARLAVQVVIGHDCTLGARCIVHSGAVIGADGFGFAAHEERWLKIEQLGAVRIGDEVEIGANTCIDRGTLDDTVLEDGVKLDNLIQIGHNVRIGAHTAMAGCVGVAGSAQIGAHCTFGGGAGVLGHLRIVDHVHITAATLVSRSILKPGQYSGAFPIDDNANWEKNAATLRQLYALRQRIKVLEKKS
ncbi:UDP-3-O-(3-hydroxymyristoyl)glucosamine N-acyltransferase [Serpentinimonas maccroryi]|uniref:UDP-3-O-(3-hydroxymyristoyl)glucosamine N-acyltransferase n=1 Tax=Serpentinimonas maccroryi TaxID=1458426 RepID=UPI0020340102|nr:UDP-3-O-(3-hydroxymyristoyl)glucosamine N-acyltransferase [Serpentinimonas maccroryi]MCM2478692.1 UDP-3-O-(3-hydroxymyristoyl)glucosamine N-acyltransferase [Serpentinimonas maccroryi]